MGSAEGVTLGIAMLRCVPQGTSLSSSYAANLPYAELRRRQPPRHCPAPSTACPTVVTSARCDASCAYGQAVLTVALGVAQSMPRVALRRRWPSALLIDTDGCTMPRVFFQPWASCKLCRGPRPFPLGVEIPLGVAVCSRSVNFVILKHV